MTKIKTAILILTALVSGGNVLTSCTSPNNETSSSDTATAETPLETSDWIVLFDGTSTDGWRGFNMDSLPANWVIEDGTLKSLGTGGDIGGDIVYAPMEFDNFELEVSWKISEGGNSGIFLPRGRR